MNVYVVGDSKYYANFITDAVLVDDINDAQVVLFTGGEDVHPKTYGRRIVTNVYTNIQRDAKEKAIFDSVRPDQLIVGICRGSQLCCALSGGNLVQDCRGHALGRTHAIYGNEDNMMYQITSTHHQMQYPFNLPQECYKILYYAKEEICDPVGDGISAVIIRSYGEPEVVLYTIPGKAKCLAIQGHPEMMPNSPVAKMLDKLIKSYASK